MRSKGREGQSLVKQKRGWRPGGCALSDGARYVAMGVDEGVHVWAVELEVCAPCTFFSCFASYQDYHMLP